MEKARRIDVEVLPPTPTAFERDERMIAFVSRLMDSMFVVPGTKISFGLDPIIGFIPWVGDGIDAIISAFLIARGARYGLPKIVLARMVVNVLINTVVGAIPIAGDVFSAWWKSNLMNYELLRKHASTRRASTKSDWIFVLALIFGMFVCIVLAAIAMLWLVAKIFHAGW